MTTPYGTGITPVMGIGAWLMLAALSVLWGGSFFFVSVAVTALPPLTIVLIRVAIAVVVLWCIVLLGRIPLPSSISAWLALQGLGVDTLAQLAIVGAALSYGLASVFGRRLKGMGISPVMDASGNCAGVKPDTVRPEHDRCIRDCCNSG